MKPQFGLTRLTLVKKRVIFIIGLVGIAGLILALNSPFQDKMPPNKRTGIIDNVNLNSSQSSVGTNVGDVAPNFKLPDAEGNIISLSSLIGQKALVINFWASWCSPCLEEMPNLEALSQDLGDELTVIGINNQETPNESSSYAAARGVTYPTVFFPKNDEVAKAYQVLAMPTTYYLDKNGIIVARKVGFDTKKGMNDKAHRAINHN